MTTIVGIGALVAAMLSSSVACKAGGSGNPFDPDREGGLPPPPPGVGPDAGPVDTGPSCPGVAITEDGVLDLDVPAERWVRVSGAVTLAGQPIPFDVGATGRIVFSRSGGGVTSVPIENGRYGALIRSGRYDARFEPDDTSCFDAERVGMPCSGGVLREALVLEMDGVLDLDVPVVRVRGAVTLNAGAYPSEEGGSIVFSRAMGEAGVSFATRPIELGGSYVVRLFPGAYDVSFGDGAAYCDGREAPRLPCGGGQIRTGVSLVSDGVLDLDVPTARVEGAVTLRGAPMPALDGSVGALAFVRADGTAVVVPLPSEAPGSYRATVLAGTYDVRFVPDGWLCGSNEPPPVPCNGGSLRDDVTLASPGGVLDLDLPAVTVRGRVTVNGAPFGAASAAGGVLAFAAEGAGNEASSVLVPLFGSGETTFATTLFPGAYTIRWQGDVSTCGGPTAPLLPCHVGVLRTGLSLVSEGVLDLDVPAVVVRGQVTVDGSTMPNAESERGQIAFLGEEVAGRRALLASYPLGAGGPASYTLTLMAGTWVPAWVAGYVCQTDPRQSVPCVGGPLSDPVSLSAPGGVLDLDVPTVEVHGRVTMGGAELPSAREERGGLTFARLEGDLVATPAFAASGPADYAITVLPGRYVVSWTPSPWLCPPTDVAPIVPCEAQPILGCPAR